MSQSPRKSMMRNLGEFFGHILHGVRTDPSKKVVRHDVEEEQRGDITLRRTTIEEVELKGKRTS
ncbi:MAG TPA: hypothetical protein PK400_07255 [Phycisphaerales bacterium]|nr:hypothetical protein [Phycisphaerales bacterium]HRQ76016.1 hypothetical protein [Phycisphaerales bacterium]